MNDTNFRPPNSEEPPEKPDAAGKSDGDVNAGTARMAEHSASDTDRATEPSAPDPGQSAATANGLSSVQHEDEPVPLAAASAQVTPDGAPAKQKTWIRKIPVWAALTATGVIAALGGFLVGAGVYTPKISALDSDLSLRTAEVDILRNKLDREESKHGRTRSEVDSLKGELSALDQEKAELNERAAELEEAEAALEARAAEVGAAEAEAAKNSFGSGTHLVGTDIEPGTYRSGASDYCYWARLSGTGGSLGDIIANGNTDGPAVVTIAPGDAAFESARCGTWTKVD